MNWNIELYATENGDEPVMQFLNSLPEKHRAKAIWEIDLLEEHGFIKKDKKTPKRELETALHYKEDYIRRFESNG